MKKLTLSICLLLLAGNAKCEVNKQQNTRIYNGDEFVGRIVGPNDNQRILDNNAQYKGRIIQDKKGESIRVYEMEDGKLKFKGRIIK